MKQKLLAISLIGLSVFFCSFAQPVEPEWKLLLDKDLSQWQTYLSFRHTSDYHGEVPVDQQGNPIPPVGPDKNLNEVFTVHQVGGEWVLRISGEIYGCLYTRNEYENYHLKLKVKWGEKKWEPRTNKLRDTGICYHSVGKLGADYWRAWMLSQEFQIMEGHMGDYWNIGPTAVDVRAFLPEGTMNPVANAAQPWVAIGTGTNNPGFCLRSENRQSPAGEWTDIELICYQGKSLHIVNGQVVMVLQNSRHVDGGKTVPLTRGKIQLQSEAAEVFYKDIRIKTITSLDNGYMKYFE